MLAEDFVAKKLVVRRRRLAKRNARRETKKEKWGQQHHFLTQLAKLFFHQEKPIESGSYRIGESRYF